MPSLDMFYGNAMVTRSIPDTGSQFVIKNRGIVYRNEATGKELFFAFTDEVQGVFNPTVIGAGTSNKAQFEEYQYKYLDNLYMHIDWDTRIVSFSKNPF